MLFVCFLSFVVLFGEAGLAIGWRFLVIWSFLFFLILRFMDVRFLIAFRLFLLVLLVVARGRCLYSC